MKWDGRYRSAGGSGEVAPPSVIRYLTPDDTRVVSAFKMASCMTVPKFLKVAVTMIMTIDG